MNRIILPINKNPYLRCYRIHAYLINIMCSNTSDFNKYLFSNYLCLHNGKENLRREYLDFHLYNNFKGLDYGFYDNSWFDLMQINILNDNRFNTKESIKELIVSFLSQDYYVLHKVNENYLPHTLFYSNNDNINIALTCGYDIEEKKFIILDYNKNGEFGLSEVYLNDYFNSLINVPKINTLNFIKTKNNLSFQFSQNNALKLLKCHLNSQNAFPDHIQFDNNLFGYEAIERSLRDMLCFGINMIRIRAIKEHKSVILNYFDYAIKNNCINNKNFYYHYLSIEHQMNIVFLKCLKKLAQRKTDYIDEIDTIRRINEIEAEFLKKYLDTM